MLILSRYKDESIMIADDVEVVIVGILRGKTHLTDRVRLGIIAPNDKTKPSFIPVHRREVWEHIQGEKQEQKKSE